MLSDTFVVEALLNLSHGAVGVDQMTDEKDKYPHTYTTLPTTSAASSSSSSAASSVQMRRAIDIVQRYHMRGKVLPHQLADRQNDPVLEQEHLDAQKLSKWRQSVKGNPKRSDIFTYSLSLLFCCDNIVHIHLHFRFNFTSLKVSCLVC
jgi:hypothetical protein